MSDSLRVLFVAAEAVPYAKTGGLADVVGTLPVALKAMGHDVRVVMPRYYSIDRGIWDLVRLERPLGVPMGIIGEQWCGVLEGRLPGSDVPIYFIEHERYYGRDGIYNDRIGSGYMDNDNRFVYLSKAALQLCKMIGFRPDVVHTHDWHTSAANIFLDTTYRNDELLRETASVLTIHNIQYQGNFYPGLMDVLDVGWNRFNLFDLEHDRQVNLLKGGMVHAHQLSTVSQGYAREIKTPEYGYGLDPVIKARAGDLWGILNGMDYDLWNPETDPHLAARYGADDLTGKAICKKAVQERFGLPVRPEVPVIGMITRLVYQKGVDIVAQVLQELLDWDLQMVILGSGEAWAHDLFPSAARSRPDRMGCVIGFDEPLAHQIEAGSDFFLMPSRFEPCGLNQMYSLRYGTLPIVRATGGLDDTVDNYHEPTSSGTGFKFHDLYGKALKNTVGWAIHTYYNRKDAMETMIRRAMSRRFTWEESARRYVAMYRRAVEKKLLSR